VSDSCIGGRPWPKKALGSSRPSVGLWEAPLSFNIEEKRSPLGERLGSQVASLKAVGEVCSVEERVVLYTPCLGRCVQDRGGNT